MKKLATLGLASLLVLNQGEFCENISKKSVQLSATDDKNASEENQQSDSWPSSEKSKTSVKEEASLLVDQIRTNAVLRCRGIRLFPGETSSSRLYGIVDLKEAYMVTKFVNRGDDPNRKLRTCMEVVTSEIMHVRSGRHSCIAFILDDIVVPSEESASQAPDYWVRKGDRIQGISLACVELEKDGNTDNK